MLANLEVESFVENRVESFAMDFSFIFLFLIREKIDFDVGIRCSRHIHSGKFFSLDYGHRKL